VQEAAYIFLNMSTAVPLNTAQMVRYAHDRSIEDEIRHIVNFRKQGLPLQSDKPVPNFLKVLEAIDNDRLRSLYTTANYFDDGHEKLLCCGQGHAVLALISLESNQPFHSFDRTREACFNELTYRVHTGDPFAGKEKVLPRSTSYVFPGTYKYGQKVSPSLR